MGRKRLYKNVAEKQKAWRIKHGQKRKVPLEIRRGEALGSSETTLRAKKESETWEAYHIYITETTAAARRRQSSAAGAGGKQKIATPGGIASRERRFTGVDETAFQEDYYELRAKYEKDLFELDGRRKKIKEK